MLLITPTEVAATAFTTGAIDSQNQIRPSKIAVAQEQFLRPRVGDQLFFALSDPQYAIFLENYIKPPLAYYTKYGLLDELAVIVDRNGVIVRVGSQSNSSSQADATKNHDGHDEQIYTQNSQDTINQTQNQEKITNEQKIGDNVYDTQTDMPKNTNEVTTGANTASSSKLTEVSAMTQKNEIQKLKTTTDQTQSTTENLQKTDKATTTREGYKDYYYKDKTLNTASQNAQRQGYQPATARQIDILRMRALSDANVLMRAAIKYIEAHSEQFPLYQRQNKFYF